MRTISEMAFLFNSIQLKFIESLKGPTCERSLKKNILIVHNF